MFKFIHAADVHLDSPLRGLSRYESAPAESIRDACRRAFENLVDLAIEEKVSFVLLAGDLYDGDWKDYSTGIFLSQLMGQLGQHDISVFAVAGNHDAANRITKAFDIAAGQDHTIMAYDKFYEEDSAGIPFVKWVKAMVKSQGGTHGHGGRPWENAECDDCELPIFCPF